MRQDKAAGVFPYFQIFGDKGPDHDFTERMKDSVHMNAIHEVLLIASPLRKVLAESIQLDAFCTHYADIDACIEEIKPHVILFDRQQTEIAKIFQDGFLDNLRGTKHTIPLMYL